MRMEITLKGKAGQVAIDQIRCIDKSRLLNKISVLNKGKINELKQVLKEYLID